MSGNGRTGIPLQVWAGVALVAIALGVLPSSPRLPARHGSAS